MAVLASASTGSVKVQEVQLNIQIMLSNWKSHLVWALVHTKTPGKSHPELTLDVMYDYCMQSDNFVEPRLIICDYLIRN